MKKIIALIAIFSLLILSGCSQQQAKTISVTGDSQLQAPADQAEVSVGVSILKSSAADAQNQASTVTNAIINAMKSSGINNISTEQLSLYEDFSYAGGKQVSLGWRAVQNLNVKTTDLSQLGNIVDISVQNGATQINNIQFELTSATENKYKQQALAEASANAKDKAATIASSLGVKLGSIKSVTESNYFYTPRVYALAATSGAGAVAEATKIMPGQVSVSGTISIEYYIS